MQRTRLRRTGKRAAQPRPLGCPTCWPSWVPFSPAHAAPFLAACFKKGAQWHQRWSDVVLGWGEAWEVEQTCRGLACPLAREFWMPWPITLRLWSPKWLGVSVQAPCPGPGKLPACSMPDVGKCLKVSPPNADTRRAGMRSRVSNPQWQREHSNVVARGGETWEGGRVSMRKEGLLQEARAFIDSKQNERAATNEISQQRRPHHACDAGPRRIRNFRQNRGRRKLQNVTSQPWGQNQTLVPPSRAPAPRPAAAQVEHVGNIWQDAGQELRNPRSGGRS